MVKRFFQHAIFLDRDGVLNQCKVRNGKPFAPRSLADFVLLPNTKLALDRLRREKFILIVATNQPDGSTSDPTDASASIDHDIAQQHLFTPLGIDDAGDERLTFVGANKDAAWLEREVHSGCADIAVTLPPVTMRQFIERVI